MPDAPTPAVPTLPAMAPSPAHRWASIRQRAPWLGRIALVAAFSGVLGIALLMQVRAWVAALPPQAASPVWALTLLSCALLLLLNIVYVFLQLHAEEMEHTQKADSEKSSFVRMAADTIRTPLTGLRWLAELLLNGDLGALNAEQQESIANMNQAIQRLIGLSNELLNVMSLPGSIIHYHAQPTDVNDLVTDAFNDAASLGKAKHLTFGFGKLSKEYVIPLDPGLVRHVVEALLNKAIHLTPVHGKIIIHVESAPEETLIGITYAGKELIIKTVDEKLVSVPGMAKLEKDENVDLTVSWEILRAAHGRFWVRTLGKEFTLFVALPKKFKE